MAQPSSPNPDRTSRPQGEQCSDVDPVSGFVCVACALPMAQYEQRLIVRLGGGRQVVDTVRIYACPVHGGGFFDTAEAALLVRRVKRLHGRLHGIRAWGRFLADDPRRWPQNGGATATRLAFRKLR